MTRVCAFTLGLLLLGASAASIADEPVSPATIADIRCVIVGSIFGSQPANANSAALLSMYFLGRIDGREPPSFSVSQAMLAQIKVMSEEDLRAEGKRCGKELEARAVYMAEVGQTLTEQKK